MLGSFFGLATYLLLPTAISSSVYFLIPGILFAVFISHYAEKAYNSHDDSRIVIDEWIGIHIALVGMAPIWGGHLILPFILFRLFDTFKGPWGNFLQKLPGGWGVTMDDVFAGILANLANRLILYLVSLTNL